MEEHPFENFVPPGSRYLLLGSFVALNAEAGEDDSKYNWFYANGRNQFWPILERVYDRPLNSKQKQQELFNVLGMAVTDVVKKCKRIKKDSADTSLKNMVYNRSIIKIIRENKIKKIYFSSRFTEKLFFKGFRSPASKCAGMEYITLPSPSPRYARMTLEQKAASYKKLLPEPE